MRRRAAPHQQPYSSHLMVENPGEDVESSERGSSWSSNLDLVARSDDKHRKASTSSSNTHLLKIGAATGVVLLLLLGFIVGRRWDVATNTREQNRLQRQLAEAQKFSDQMKTTTASQIRQMQTENTEKIRGLKEEFEKAQQGWSDSKRELAATNQQLASQQKSQVEAQQKAKNAENKADRLQRDLDKLAKEKENDRSGKAVETRKTATETTPDLAPLFRHLLKTEFGDGPYYVQFQLHIPENQNETSSSSLLPHIDSFFTVELFADTMPTSVFFFLQQTKSGTWDDRSFHYNDNHVLLTDLLRPSDPLNIPSDNGKSPFSSFTHHIVSSQKGGLQHASAKGLAHLPYAEYNDKVPHDAYTVSIYIGSNRRM